MTSTWHGGRSTIVGPVPGRTMANRSTQLPAELMCICALCKCGKHRCPVHPPSIAFLAETTYEAEYTEKQVAVIPPPEATLRPKTAGPAFPGTARLPVAVPFFGKTTYSASYTGEASPRNTIMHGYLPMGGPFLGRSTYRKDFSREAAPYDPPATSVLPARAVPPPPEAAFDAVSTHMAHYKPYEGAHRPASFARPQTGASTLTFSAQTEYERTYVEKDMHSAKPDSFRPPTAPVLTKDRREFSTEHAQQYVPKEAHPDGLCPAARLPPPPGPQAAPQAWEGQHVLWDTTTGGWAVQ